MDTIYLTPFLSNHIPYIRCPSCALFPIEAIRVGYSSHYALWLVYERPPERICVAMDVCIMPCSYSGGVSVRGTIRELREVRQGWALFDLQAATTSSVVLCVPVSWANWKDGGLVQLWIVLRWCRPAWLLQISPEIFSTVFNAVREGLLDGSEAAARTSLETVRWNAAVSSSVETIEHTAASRQTAERAQSSVETIRPMRLIPSSIRRYISIAGLQNGMLTTQYAIQTDDLGTREVIRRMINQKLHGSEISVQYILFSSRHFGPSDAH